MMNKHKLLYLIIPLILIFMISNFSYAMNIDVKTREIVLSSENDLIKSSMHFISRVGGEELSIPLAYSLPGKEYRKDLTKAICINALITYGLKSSIGKRRPPGPIEYKHFTSDSSYHSMPSGHTSHAFAIATVIARYHPKYKFAAYTLATLIGISRVYDDKHWITDVAVGAGVGYLSAKFVELKW